MIPATKLLASASVVALMGAVVPAQAANITLKLGEVNNTANVWYKASVYFGKQVSRLTNGKVAVKVYPNSTLGSEMDMINGMQLGTVDMTITGESLENWAPKAALVAIPYAYTSLAQMDKIASGPIGKSIEKQIIKRAKIIPIAYFPRGPRELTSNRPIRKPSDLHGLKMRVPNVPLYVKMWRALGADPVPMAFSSVFTALQNGTVQAQENPLALIKSASFYQVQKYVNLTNHVRSWIYLTISEKTFNRMSKSEQQAVLKAGRLTQTYEHKLFLKSQTQLRRELKNDGMTFVKADDAAFKAKAEPAVIAGVPASIRPTVKKLFAMK